MCSPRLIVGRGTEDLSAPEADLMNKRMVSAAKCRQIGWIVGSPSSNALKMMNMQPALVRAAVAFGVDEGAAPAVTGVDGVDLVRREGLAFDGRRFSGPHARF